MNNSSFIAFVVLNLFLGFSARGLEIEIDGELDEIEWEKASESSISYQVFPATLKKLNNQFSYKVITTEQGIYLGLEADSKKSLRRRTQENDSLFSNDHFQIVLDMNNNGQDSFVFAINHQGNYFDGVFNFEKELDLDWNAQWDFKVVVEDDEWIAEIFIPWHSMAFNINEQNQFGLYISRFDENTNATYASIPANIGMNSFYKQLSKHSVAVKSESRFDLYPYISMNRNLLNNHNNGSVGTEVYWKPNDTSRFSATINPDFGQVESDELIVNFSAIESFFSEKRPFFNDNQSLFEVTGPESLRIVHTPRIGGESYYDEDYKGELKGAVNYSVTQANFDLGILTAFENSAVNNQGRDFFAIRGQHAFNENKLGFSINYVETPSIAREATVVSTDLNYALFEDVSLNIGIVATQAKVQGITQQDIGWWLSGSSDYFDQHTHEFNLFSYGDNLQLNDIGFVQRINRKQFEYEYQYEIPDFNSYFIRDLIFSFEAEIKTNFQGQQLPRAFGAGIELITEDEFEYQLSVETISSGFDDLTTRGNNSIWMPSALVVEAELSSPEYSWGKYEGELTYGTEGWDGHFYTISGLVERQFSDDFHISLGLSQYNSDSWIDWDEENVIEEFNFTEQEIELNLDFKIDEVQELRIKFETVIGKAKGLGSYEVAENGQSQLLEENEDFAFSETAFQVRYKYSLSKLTAFYLSYSFGGEYEDEIAKFGKRNLHKKGISSKNAHNVFAKIRLHF